MTKIWEIRLIYDRHLFKSYMAIEFMNISLSVVGSNNVNTLSLVKNVNNSVRLHIKGIKSKRIYERNLPTVINYISFLKVNGC